MEWWSQKIKHLSLWLKKRGYPFARVVSEIEALFNYSEKKELPSIESLQNIMFTGQHIQSIWLNYSHRELKEIFSLGSSPVISKQITTLKELAAETLPHHALVTATLLLMSFKGKSSEIISQYLNVILKGLASESPRASASLIAPGQVEELHLALAQISDEQLRHRCPESYEVLTTALYNSLSDIGRALMRSPNGIVFPPFKNFHDLSQKIARRWNFLYAPYVKYPVNEILLKYNQLKFQGYEIKLITNSSELYSYSVDLENCLHTYSENLRRKEKNYFLLAREGKVTWVCEVDMHMKIVDLKGAYNKEAPDAFKQDLQFFINKKGNQ